MDGSCWVGQFDLPLQAFCGLVRGDHPGQIRKKILQLPERHSEILLVQDSSAGNGVHCCCTVVCNNLIDCSLDLLHWHIKPWVNTKFSIYFSDFSEFYGLSLKICIFVQRILDLIQQLSFDIVWNHGTCPWRQLLNYVFNPGLIHPLKYGLRLDKERLIAQKDSRI